jgi:hypothetical protein
VALVWLAGCGGAAGDDSSGDAAVSSDGGSYCESVVSLSPMSPVAPAEIFVTGSITGSSSGAEQYSWDIRKQGDPDFDPGDPGDASSFSFIAPTDGFYEVTLFGSRGQSCSSGSAGVNVLDTDSNTVFYRVRVVPGTPELPVQEHVRTVSGVMSSVFQIDDIALDSVISVGGLVRDSNSAPVQAYLRFTTIGDIDPMATEAFSTAQGAFEVALSAGTYDVLVVPQDNSIAPVELRTVPVNNLGQITVPVASAVMGTVLDPGGTPVMGATVSLRIDGVPTTIATTDAAGVFTVLGHLGGATSVHVTPPADSGLPNLELDISAGLVAAMGENLTVRYAASLTSRSLSVPVRMVDGTTPAPGARVTFASHPIAAAATITPGAAAALSMAGASRVTATADGAGDLPATSLPETMYDVIVEPPNGAPADQGVALLAVDLQMGAPDPATLALVAWATLTGDAIDESSVGLDEIRITAIPSGVLAGTTTAAAMASTDAGSYSLPVAGGGEYDLVFDSADYSRARARVSAQAGAAGQATAVADVEMPAALAASGDVTLGANGVAGVSVTLLCYECSGQMEASLPVAEAVTDISGSYTLAVPNPGVD